MGLLLDISRVIDAIGNGIGRLLRWLILASVLISAGNAIIRKLFNVSSNAYLEIQWYLFATVFLLGAGFAFLRNAHVRIDFVSSRFSRRTNAIIDAVGIVVVVLPLCAILVNLSWPLFLTAYQTGEMSQNAGGLIRWPVYLMVPLGFALLALQALSELIKRIAFLRGLRPSATSADEGGKSEEERLAEELAAEAALHERQRVTAPADSRPKD